MQQKKRKIVPSSLKSLLAKRQEIYYLLILLKVKFFIFLKSQIHVVISSLMKLLNSFFKNVEITYVQRRCYRVLKFIFCSIYAIIMLSSLYSSLIKKISKVLLASIKITNDDTNYVLNLGSELAHRSWREPGKKCT